VPTPVPTPVPPTPTPAPTPTPVMFATIYQATPPAYRTQDGAFRIQTLPGAHCYLTRSGGGLSDRSTLGSGAWPYSFTTDGNGRYYAGWGASFPGPATYNISATCWLTASGPHDTSPGVPVDWPGDLPPAPTPTPAPTV
jgi:hypothetical protein